MLSKLLKYDFKNLYKTLLPIYLITVVITILTVILNNLSDTSNLFSTLNGLMILSYVVILMVLMVGTFFLSIRDFYLDFATERGYLINTLPVKKSTIITSKFITGVTTMITSFVVMFISILILVIGNGEWSSFANGIADIFKNIPTDGVVMLILMSVLMIVAYISGLAVCFLSIALGQLKNTNKLGFSFLAYIILYIIYEMYFTFSLTFIGTISSDFINRLDSEVGVVSSINISFGIVIGLVVIITAIMVPITNYILKNKLNLE